MCLCSSVARVWGPTHIVTRGVIFSPRLDAIGQEAEDCPYPQKDGEAPKELSAELDPFWGSGWWCERIRPISRQDLLGFAVCQALEDKALIWEPSQRSPPSPRSNPPPTRTQNCQLPALLPQSPGSTPPHLHAVGVVFPADLFYRHLVLCLEKDLGEIVIISQFLWAGGTMVG